MLDIITHALVSPAGLRGPTLAMCALLSAAPTGAAHGQSVCPLFPCPTTNISSFSWTQTTGDVNHDGAVDVIVGYSSTVGVYINDGNGGFVQGSTYAIQNQPAALIIANLDADEHPDLLTASSNSGSMSVLRGNGDGTFSTAQHYLCGQQPWALDIADIDGDGDLDVIVANTITTGTLSVMTNSGDGVFTKTATLSAGNSPSSIAIGRLNDDDAPDIAYIYRQSPSNGGAAAIRLNNGDGTYGVALVELEAPNWQFNAVRIGDTDLDGDQDIMVLSPGIPIYRLINDGSAGFKILGMPFGLGGTSASAFGDLNNDGRSELVSIQPSGGAAPRAIYVYWAQADGSFNGAQQYWAVEGPNSVSVDDVDNDGLMDVFVGQGGGFTYLKGDGTGSLLAETVLVDSAGPSKLIPVDIDLDGDLDLVGNSNFVTAQSFFVLKNNGGWNFGPLTHYTYQQNTGGHDIVLADMDGDDDLDALINGNNSDSLYLMTNTGLGVFVNPVQYQISNDMGRMAAADFDGDDDVDVVIPVPGTQNSGTTLVLFKNNGQGVLSPPTSIPCGTTPNNAVAADVDLDGDTDLLVTNAGYFNGTPAVSVFKNDGSATFASPLVTPIDGRPSSVTVSDLDGDGDIDAVVTISHTISGGLSNKFAICTNDGTGIFTAQYTTIGPNSYSSVINDVNGDERPDIIIPNYSGSGVFVLVNQGQGSYQTTMYSTIDEPLAPAVDDFDGDGLADIVISHQAGNFPIYALINQGSFATITQQPADVTVSSGQPVELQIQVTGPQELTFQWTRNDVPLVDDRTVSGSTSPVLQINPATEADSGEYRVRISNGHCELSSIAAHVTVTPACLGDVTPPGGNGVVNIDDLLLVISHWGQGAGDPADVNADGTVNIEDLLSIIGAWGPCL